MWKRKQKQTEWSVAVEKKSKADFICIRTCLLYTFTNDP